ncbi:MAG: DNA helicase II [Acidobacteriota bacterium]|nr:MAG: DNA helicase II [Acidobacteriota bacterium]
MTPRFLEDLNEQQREAVTSPDGPRLVLAGAGSGKTRVIVYRMAYLIEARGVSPDTLLAVTFTNKAADEMRSRVRAILRSSEDAAVHTFHALCLRLLRRFSEDIGLRSGFTLYGSDERKSLLRRICRDEGIAEREFPVSRIASSVSAHKLRTFDGGGGGGDSRFQRLLEAVALRYQKELDAQGAVDFDDLLLRAVELMECSERAQAFAERRFQHVLVDEYQDTNRIQYRLLRLLAPHKNIFVVGDDDQSIYNFRGADMRYILDFETDFPNATTIKLEVNYRSSGAILRAASAVIENNRSRKGKRLIASRDEGLPPELYGAEDDRAEAAHVARRLDELRKQDDSQDAAILLRTHAQTRVFEEELLARGIPHRVLGGLRFYDRKEIKDALGYARLVLNRHDDASFLRVANMPIRGVGKASITIVQQAAEKAGSSLWDASLEALGDDLLPGRARVGLTQFREVVEKLAGASPDDTPSRVLRRVFTQTGLVNELEREGEAVARERKENLDQLVAAATEYEAGPAPTLAGFLDSVSLLTDMDTVGSTPCLLMTLHAAKGLEFDTVFLAGLEEGLFPHIRASGDMKGLEEERRLFYVGMTRAKRRLYLSFALSRRFSYQTSARRPSRFLIEIPEAALVTPTGTPTEPLDRFVETSPLRQGALVHHAKFGEGKVLDASGTGPDRRVTVLFRTAGRKRLVAQYAKLEIVG